MCQQSYCRPSALLSFSLISGNKEYPTNILDGYKNYFAPDKNRNMNNKYSVLLGSQTALVIVRSLANHIWAQESFGQS